MNPRMNTTILQEPIIIFLALNGQYHADWIVAPGSSRWDAFWGSDHDCFSGIATFMLMSEE